MEWIDDDSSLPDDPATRVVLRDDVGTHRLDRFDFQRFEEGIPPEQTLIRVQTATNSLYVLWYIGTDADGAVAVVVQSDSCSAFHHPRVAFYERLDSRQEGRLRPDCIQSGHCMRFTFVNDLGRTQRPIATSPVWERGITLLIGADVSRFEAARAQFQAVITSKDFADTVWTELVSLPESERRAVNRIVRGLSLPDQAVMRAILQAANEHERLEAVASELIRLQSHRQGNDDFVTQSVMGYLQRFARR